MERIDKSYKLIEEVAPIQLSGRGQAIYAPETRRELVSCHNGLGNEVSARTIQRTDE